MKKKLSHSESDFSIENLPHSRKDQFFDLLKHRYKTILLLGAFIALFSLPSLAVSFFEDYAKSNYLASSSSAGLSQEALSQGLGTIDELANLYLIPALAILYVGFAGLTKIFHLLCYGESVLFFHDFYRGLKENYLPFLIMGLLAGGFRYLDGVVYDMNGLNIVVRLMPLVLDADLLFPMTLVFLSLSSIYEMKLKTRIYDSFVFYLKGFPFILVFALLILAPILLDYVNLVPLKFSLLLLLLLLYAPLLILSLDLYLASLYDKELNTNFPQQLHRGLYSIENESDVGDPSRGD